MLKKKKKWIVLGLIQGFLKWVVHFPMWVQVILCCGLFVVIWSLNTKIQVKLKTTKRHQWDYTFKRQPEGVPPSRGKNKKSRKKKRKRKKKKKRNNK